VLPVKELTGKAMTLPIRQQKETVTRYAANSQHTSYSQMQHETNGAAGTELITTVVP
jgi:hypothetical protein